MATALIVRNGIVINRIELGDMTGWTPPHEGDLLVTSVDGDIGDAYDVELKTITPQERPVEPEGVPDIISDRQFFQILALQGLITIPEALAAVKTGEVPAVMMAFITSLPPGQQFAAQMLLAGATTFQRSHPLVQAFAQAMGMTSAQVDQLWIDASGI